MLQMNDNFALNILDQAIVGSSIYEIGIYSGQMPDPNAIGFAIASYNPQRLAVAATSTANLFQRVGSVIRFNRIPERPIAVATGIATWFAAYYTASGAMSSASDSRIIVGTITDYKNGSGILLLEDVNIAVGKPINIIEFGIRVA